MAQDDTALAYRSILVAFDGSPSAMLALRRALALAKLCGSQVTVLTIDEALPLYAPGVGAVYQPPADERAFHEELHGQARELAAAAGVAIQTVGVEGHAGEEILRRAEADGSDLIALGHTGHRGLLGTLLGSTTRQVVDEASCDVLVAK